MLPNPRAVADEASAWSALESATSDAELAAGSLKLVDEGQLGEVGETFDHAIDYLEGIVNGGKDRDTGIEALLDSAFASMDNALQSDGSAAASFETAADYLQLAAGALQNENFATAESEAAAAADELLITYDHVTTYSMDLTQLETDNDDLAAAIDSWLNGGGGGGMCPP